MGLLAVLSTKDFTALIQRVDLTHWRQILAILCTFVYDEFPHYCEVLGAFPLPSKSTRYLSWRGLRVSSVTKTAFLWLLWLFKVVMLWFR